MFSLGACVQEFGSDGGMWNLLAWRAEQANAAHLDRPLTPYELACQLMVPLYAARCAVWWLHGRALSLHGKWMRGKVSRMRRQGDPLQHVLSSWCLQEHSSSAP